VYANDPHWVAPLEVETRAFLDRRRHPFYKHGEAVQFLAQQNGQTVGRILVSDDPRFNNEHGTNLGCFGMFESIDDQHVADGLLNTAANWLRRRGRSEIMGPIDYSTNYPSGLLVDGFQSPPRIMMNHHPRYYARLLENWGLRKLKDLYAWWLDAADHKMGLWRERVERIVRGSGVTVRPMRFDDFDAEVARARTVYNAMFQSAWGFVKMTAAEFDHLARQVRRVAEPGLIWLAEAGGEPVGLSITLPDMNEATKPLGGRLARFGVPAGLVRLAFARRRIKTARVCVLGVVPAFRRRGVAELLILRTLDVGKNVMNLTGAELSWTLEDNPLINRTIEQVGGVRYKTYRVYRKALAR
jgi:GNAT superfamily N-acetyltransferase